MKTETQVAKKFIKRWKSAKENFEELKETSRHEGSLNLARHYMVVDEKIIKEHKQSCERFLKFLKDIFGEEFVETEGFDMIIKNKITDLKKAIKLYKENRL